MKKVVYCLLALGLFISNSYAACILSGAVCTDERGNTSIAGQVFNGTGQGLPSLTKTQVLTAVPSQTGAEIWCSNCTNFNNALGMLCLSSGTVAGAYMAVSSATAVTACQ